MSIRYLPQFVMLCGLLVTIQTYDASAQQVQLTSPFQNLNDSFYENIGFGWGMSGSGRNGNWAFNTGPSSSAVPPFGGWDPGADAHFGFGGSAGGMNFGFGGVASQGSSRSNVVNAPTVVVPNGGTGSFFSGSIRPFVTGVVPVVGSAPMVPVAPPVSPVAQALQRMQQEASSAAPLPEQVPVGAVAAEDAPLLLGATHRADEAAMSPSAAASSANSTANYGDISVAEIKQQQALEDAQLEQDILVRIEKARGYEQAGKLSFAKMYYQQAAKRAEGELRMKLLAKIRSLDE